MTLEYKDTLNVKEYSALRDAVGFKKIIDEQAEAGISNSYRVICCHDGDKAVGCARLLWDGGYTAFLSDVMVEPSYQRRGIGSRMVNELIGFLKSQLKGGWNVKINLIAAKGKEPFYETFGFINDPNDTLGAGMHIWIRK